MDAVTVIDADGHVLETDAELEQYFDGDYKGHRRTGTFSVFPSLDGWPRGFVRGLNKLTKVDVNSWIEFIEGSIVVRVEQRLADLEVVIPGVQRRYGAVGVQHGKHPAV